MLLRQAFVIASVELGLMSRIDIGLVEAPVMNGRVVDIVKAGPGERAWTKR